MLNALFLRNPVAATPTDPYWPYVSLLANTTSSNGAQNNTFLDSSTNNFTITRNGNTTQGSFTPYGSNWSNYFDGSGDYLTVSAQTALSFGTGDFTIEAWVNPSSYIGFYAVIDARDSGSGSGNQPWIFGLRNSSSTYYVELFLSDTAKYTGSIAVPLNSWTHIAVSRSSGTLKTFVNGIVDYNASMTNNVNANGTTQQIGRVYDPIYNLGYLSNVRIVKAAVYTSAFTPPAAPLTAISGTSLLTCQSNRFIDNSSNNFAITKNGDTKVTPFSPFSPTSAYSTTANGGSAYFDNNGDYLSAPASSNLSFALNNFTIEAWVYGTGSFSTDPICESRASGPSTGGYAFLVTSSGNLNVYTAGGFAGASTGTISPGAWNHVALVRSGVGANQTTYYINGVASGTITLASTLTDPATNETKIGGSTTAGENWGGFISNLRIVNGTAVYSGNFTPPTAPVTAITNTSLLLNATNAGIYDSAVQNDMETVGNAQVSTTQAKFGTTSMYFDGTNSIATTAKKVPCISGTGNFTIEFWFYPSSIKLETLVSMITTVSSVNPHIYMDASGYVNYYTAGAQRIAGSIQLSSGQWYHIAVARSSGTTKLFINGTQSGSSYTDGNSYVSPAYLNVGQYMSSDGVFYTSEWLNGYIDELRVTAGVARYTANFTPPTAAFPVQ